MVREEGQLHVPVRRRGYGDLWLKHEKSVGGSWWVASAVDDEGEGEIYCAEFTGPRAEELAVEYAEWKNGQC